jgi:hypothetical protein
MYPTKDAMAERDVVGEFVQLPIVFRAGEGRWGRDDRIAECLGVSPVQDGREGALPTVELARTTKQIEIFEHRDTRGGVVAGAKAVAESGGIDHPVTHSGLLQALGKGLRGSITVNYCCIMR